MTTRLKKALIFLYNFNISFSFLEGIEKTYNYSHNLNGVTDESIFVNDCNNEDQQHVIQNIFSFLKVELKYACEKEKKNKPRQTEKTNDFEPFNGRFFFNFVPTIILKNHRILFTITNDGIDYDRIKSIAPCAWCYKEQGFQYLPKKDKELQKKSKTSKNTIRFKNDDQDLKIISSRSKKDPLVLDICRTF